jgi:hypothetical protein
MSCPEKGLTDLFKDIEIDMTNWLKGLLRDGKIPNLMQGLTFPSLCSHGKHTS